MFEFFEDFWDEVTDFFEDFGEVLSKKSHPEGIKYRQAMVGGVAVKVRPAYIFAQRLDDFLKLIIGLSITISAFTASFFGVGSLSDLIDLLVTSFLGRVMMLVIGLSYIILAVWKLLHLKTGKPLA